MLAADIVCIAILFFMYLFTSTFHVFTQYIAMAVQLMVIPPAALIALSVLWKGTVPLIICLLGIVLMHNAVILPYLEPDAREVTAGGRFFLGLGMVAFSMITAYQPTVLFTRNRPESLECEWSKYPVWQDNMLLTDGRTDRSVSVKSLMTDVERYLMWRYEYILAVIYGTPNLVRPNGLVPKDSTIVRDRESGQMIGKPRYTGFFM